MSRSFLDLSAAAMQGIGLPAPSTFVSTSDPHALKIKSQLRDIQEELRERKHSGTWQRLRKRGTFTSVGTETQVSDIKSTWTDLRHIIGRTMWDETARRPMRQIMTESDYAAHKGAAIGTGDYFWRLSGDAILFPGTPTAGRTIAFTYESDNWVRGSDSTDKAEITADDDEPMLPDQLFEFGLQLRYLDSTGLEYGEKFRRFERAVGRALSIDTPAEAISLTCGGDGFDFPSIPDRDFPQVA